MTDDAFEVDVDELLHVVDRMAACEGAFSDLAADLERRIRELHVTWQGDAAEAHQQAQAAWDHGFRDMRDALGRMRGAAHTAHGNYTAAADTNLRMWEQVR
jgi:WXG100 family type VII secretion target